MVASQNWLRKVQNLIIREKKLAAVVISISILTSILAFSVFYYNFSKRDAVSELEEADFIIDRFDIIDGTAEAIILQIRLSIVNYSRSDLSDSLELKRFDLVLINNSVEIFEANLDLGGEINIFGESQTFEIPLLIETQSQVSTFTGFISNILLGVDFDLDFKGVVHYQVGEAFEDRIEFNNQLKFRLDQDLLDFTVDLIEFEGRDSYNSEIIFSFNNPFSSPLTVNGTASVYIADYYFGFVETTQMLAFAPGGHNWSLPLLLTEPAYRSFPELFYRYDQILVVTTNLTIQLNQAIFDINPSFKIQIEDDLIKITGEGIQGLAQDPDTGVLSGKFKVNLLNNMPIEFNISSVVMQVTTLSGSHLGVISWASSFPVELVPARTVVIENVLINLTDVSLIELLTITTDGAIKISSGILTINFYDVTIEFEFEIDSIEL